MLVLVSRIHYWYLVPTTGTITMPIYAVEVASSAAAVCMFPQTMQNLEDLFPQALEAKKEDRRIYMSIERAQKTSIVKIQEGTNYWPSSRISAACYGHWPVVFRYT